MADSLTLFLLGLEPEVEPHASRTVRRHVVIALRDDDFNVELPTCYSRRSLYERWVFSRGLVCKADCDGNYGPMSNYHLREPDGDLFDGECLPVCSFGSFCFVPLFRRLARAIGENTPQQPTTWPSTTTSVHGG